MPGQLLYLKGFFHKVKKKKKTQTNISIPHELKFAHDLLDCLKTAAS